MHVDPAIFKAYDIRGLYPGQLDESTGRAVGRAFATLLQPEQVVVGRDMRLSSPAVGPVAASLGSRTSMKEG